MILELRRTRRRPDAKKIAVVGMSGSIDRASELSTEELFKICGNNTGNLVFWHAFRTHIVVEDEPLWMPFQFDPELANSCDLLVFILANHVNPGLDLGRLAEKLERVRVPIVAFGLGAQSGLGEDINWLPQGSHEFFRLLAERAETIGIRGKFTNSVLNRFGIRNTEIIGCVSNFISDAPRRSVRSLDAQTMLHCIGLNNDFIEKTGPINRMVARLFPDAAIDFMAQAPVVLLHYARNELDRIAPDERDSIEKSMSSATGCGVIDRRRHRVHAIFDTRAWLEYVRRHDIALGSRMHGNMVAFQAGVPTVFVPHDSRTEEMATTMELPRLALSACNEIATREDLRVRVSFEPVKYLDTRADLKRRYVALLKRAGLQVAPSLARM